MHPLTLPKWGNFLNVHKRFFCTWKELSQYLGFKDECVLDVDYVMPEFARTQF